MRGEEGCEAAEVISCTQASRLVAPCRGGMVVFMVVGVSAWVVSVVVCGVLGGV